MYTNIIYTFLLPRQTGKAWIGILEKAMLPEIWEHWIKRTSL